MPICFLTVGQVAVLVVLQVDVIGGETLNFSQTAKETMEDKIKRLLREEVRKM